MTIDEFNSLDAEQAAAAVAGCVAVPGWVDAVVAGRPYADVDEAVTAADAQAARWSAADLDAALADHPRIGERHGGDGDSARWSRAEQSGVDRSDGDVAARLADGNARYEARFDRIYLVRAKGRSAEEMLELLEQRLRNDDATEVEVTRGQLAEIAALRLREVLA